MAVVKHELEEALLGLPAGDADAHFQQMAQSVDSGTLSQGIAAAMMIAMRKIAERHV